MGLQREHWGWWCRRGFEVSIGKNQSFRKKFGLRIPKPDQRNWGNNAEERIAGREGDSGIAEPRDERSPLLRTAGRGAESAHSPAA